MKKLFSILLCFIIVLSGITVTPQIGTHAATSLPDSIYIQQGYSATCTLAASTMMLRARMYLSGNSAWSSVTEDSLLPVAWISEKGLRHSFTYNINGNSMSVAHSYISGISISSLKSLLNSHPEGIVLYCGNGNPAHAVFITDYEGDTFYCADSAGGSYSGNRRTLASSLLGNYYGWSQENILANTTAYWYVSGYSITPTDIGTIPYPVTHIYSDKKVYNTSENITINWEPAVGTFYYWIYLWKDGKELYSFDCGTKLSFTSAPTSEGDYTFIIRPGNIHGFNDNSINYKFTVTDNVPEPVTTLTSEKSIYKSTEYINFTWDPVYGAEYYWVYLWKDGKELYGLDCGSNTTFTSAPTSPGNYTLIIRPGNINGFNNNSTKYKFIVSDGYTIKYNANGGYNSPSSQFKDYDSNLTLSDNIPSREGYVFSGWGISPDSVEPKYQPKDIYSENSDITLYAIWLKEEPHTLGDVDGDGKVSILDATAIQQHLADITQVSEDTMLAADADKDSVLSVMDATHIQRFIARLIPEL